MKKRSVRMLLLAAICIAILCLGSRTFALNRYLKIGFNSNLPPYQYLDDTGACVGMHVEMLNAIAENKGFHIEYVPFQTNRMCLEALENGDVDILLGVIENSLSEGPFAYTDTLTSSSLCMIARNDILSDADAGTLDEDVRTAVFASDTTRNTLLSNMDFDQYICVGNQVSVFQRQLESNDLAMIGIKDSLIYQINQDHALSDYTILSNHLDTINYTLVVQESDRELLRTLNEGIAQLKASPAYEDIYNRWIVVEHSAQFERVLKQIGIGAGVVLIGALFYILITLRMQHILKRRVAQQTHEIQAANNEMEKQLAQIQDENDLRTRIIKYSPNAMLLFDENYIVTLINNRACEMADAKQSCVGQSALSLPVFKEIIRQAGREIFEHGNMIENQSIKIGGGIGSFQSYRYTMHQVILYGKVIQILLTVQNVTKEELEKQAAFESEKNRALMRIAAGVAHEIRNPLMSIRTFASLVGTRGNDRAVQESFAQYVPIEVDRINKLVENLIHYTKPVKRNVEMISVSDVLAECLHLLSPLIQKAKASLVKNLDGSLYITADRDQMKQIFINLIMNGVEAIEKKLSLSPAAEVPPHLYVATAADAEWAVISIKDEGIGMSADEIQQCTDPFFTTKLSGTGLGLALCKQYISDNGGLMEITSTAREYTEISLRFARCRHES